MLHIASLSSYKRIFREGNGQIYGTLFVSLFLIFSTKMRIVLILAQKWE